MNLFQKVSLTVAFVALAASAGAQGRGGMGMGGGNGFNRGPVGGTRTLPPSEERGGLQLGPPGRWWDNKDLARTIGLNSAQQHRMDDLFTSNRDVLLKAYTTLQHEESQLEKITRSRELDENQIFQQIDRVTAARGDLEKATAHMQLQIRKELTADQTAKLDELRPPTGQ
jgi:Spy/CpxP family protein refolding chaperone